MASISALHLAELFGPEEVGLVEHDHVGAKQLVLVDLLERVVVVDRTVGLPLRRELGRIVGEAALGHGRGIHDRHDAIDRHLGPDGRPVEGLDERLRQGEARGFDDDVVGPRRAGQQRLDGGDEIVRHGAAQAAVGEFDDVLLRTGLDAAGAQDVAVDPDVAELVDHERQPPPMRLSEQVADHRGLAGAQKAGDHRDGNLVQLAHAACPSGRDNAGAGGTRATTPFLMASERCFQGIRPSGVAP